MNLIGGDSGIVSCLPFFFGHICCNSFGGYLLSFSTTMIIQSLHAALLFSLGVQNMRNALLQALLFAVDSEKVHIHGIVDRIIKGNNIRYNNDDNKMDLVISIALRQCLKGETY